MADYDLKTTGADVDGPFDDNSVLFGADNQVVATPKPYSFGGIKTWIRSWFAVGDLNDVAWQTWVPTFTTSTVGGTPITAVTSGQGARYKQIGKTVFFALDATISDVGVGNNGQFIASLPVAAKNAGGVLVGSGKEAVTIGKLLGVQLWSANQVAMVTYDNLSLVSGGNGTRAVMGGFYEAA